VCIAVMELKNVRRCKWEQVVVNLAQLRRHLHSVIKSIRVNHTYNNQ
jgi:endo-1,4-beta-mannosidase